MELSAFHDSGDTTFSYYLPQIFFFLFSFVMVLMLLNMFLAIVIDVFVAGEWRGIVHRSFPFQHSLHHHYSRPPFPTPAPFSVYLSLCRARGGWKGSKPALPVLQSVEGQHYLLRHLQVLFRRH